MKCRGVRSGGQEIGDHEPAVDGGPGEGGGLSRGVFREPPGPHGLGRLAFAVPVSLPPRVEPRRWAVGGRAVHPRRGRAHGGQRDPGPRLRAARGAGHRSRTLLAAGPHPERERPQRHESFRVAMVEAIRGPVVRRQRQVVEPHGAAPPDDPA
jgi:hypothetical protein